MNNNGRVYIVADDDTDDPKLFLAPVSPSPQQQQKQQQQHSTSGLPPSFETAVASVRRNRFGASIFSTMTGLDSSDSLLHPLCTSHSPASTGVDNDHAGSSNLHDRVSLKTMGYASWTPAPPTGTVAAAAATTTTTTLTGLSTSSSPSYSSSTAKRRNLSSPASPSYSRTTSIALPSAAQLRPLSVTLARIMEDTFRPEFINEKNKRDEFLDKESHRNIMTSQMPLDKESREHSGTMQRVGIFYSDEEHLQHLPGGHKGHKTFLVPVPPDVHAVQRAAAAALDLSVNAVQLGYLAADGVTKTIFRHDDDLRKFLGSQPRLVPFVAVFVVPPSHSAITASTTPSTTTTNRTPDNKERRQLQEQQQQQQLSQITGDDHSEAIGNDDDEDGNQEDDDDGIFQHQPKPDTTTTSLVMKARPVSAPASRVLQQHYQELIADTNVAATTVAQQPTPRPNSATIHSSHHQRQQHEHLRIDGAHRVMPSATSERGLEVLPPLASPSSISSAWRLGVDNTCVSSAAPSRAGLMHHEQQRQSRPLHSRPSSAARLIRSPSAHLSGMGALSQSMVNLFDKGSLNEETLDNIFSDLCHQTQQVLLLSGAGALVGGSGSAASINNSDGACRSSGVAVSPSPRAPSSIGTNNNNNNSKYVLTSVLLEYLDTHCADFGTKRRLETAMGALMLRRYLTRDHVALVLLRIAKE